MKALKKAEYNPDVVGEHLTSDHDRAPPISGTPAQAANAFVAPPPPPTALLMKALLLGLLVLGAASVWFLLRPTPQPPIYLRQPQTAAPDQPGSPLIPQASNDTTLEPAPARPAEAPPPQTVLSESVEPPPPPIIAEKSVPPASVKVPSKPAPVAAATPLIASVEPDLLSAYQALQRGEYKAAEELYKNVRERHLGNVDALLGSAVIAAYQNQTDQALQFYTRVLELDATNSLAQAGLIGIIGKSDVSLAETRLKELIANKPAAHFYFALGNLYATQGQWEQAQAAYFEAHHLQPLHADYSYNLAVALDQMRLPGPALQYYLKAQSLSETKSNILFDRAKLNRRIAELKNTAP